MEEKLQANPDFIARKIADEVILVPVGKAAQTFNGIASLNETGMFLWKLIEKGKTRQELYDCLAKEYELTAEESKQDVDAFLEPAMKEHMIIQC